MNNLEAVKALWERTKTGNHNIESLSSLLADYGQLLGTIIAGNDSYKSSLRRLHEELPDLQRLVTKKHDAVLKGRLQDALNTLKKKMEAEEQPSEPPAPAQGEGNPGPGEMTLSLQEEKKPLRNMPNLGMD